MNELPLFEDWNRMAAVVPAFVVRCGTAALCGAMIGLERELKSKPAGFRTNILICLGAAMYMTVGLLITNEGGEAESDPARIAAQVVTGIGFLGAGCIIQQRNRIVGLTTAATIWVVAAIGLVAGAGFPILAFLSAAMVLLTLVVLGKVEMRVLNPSQPDEFDDDGP